MGCIGIGRLSNVLRCWVVESGTAPFVHLPKGLLQLHIVVVVVVVVLSFGCLQVWFHLN